MQTPAEFAAGTLADKFAEFVLKMPLESPLKYMRAFVAIKGRCSTCRQEVSSKDVAYCQKCRRKFSLPYEVVDQQLVSFDIKSLRRSRLAEKDILTAVNLSINGQGRLININDIPF